MSVDFATAGQLYNLGSASTIDNLFNTPGGTLMAWIAPDTSGGGSLGRIFDKTTFLFNCDNSLTTDSFSFEHARAGTIGRWRMPTSQASYGNWQHVCVTYDGSSTANDPVFYFNGATVTVTETSTPTSTISADGANTLYLGNRAAADRTFDGDIEDARFYNRILSANEVATIYASKGHDGIVSGLRGRWLLPGEGGIGATALSTCPDYSGNANTGALTGTPAITAGVLSPRRMVNQAWMPTPDSIDDVFGSDLAYWFRADQGLTLSGTDVNSWADITGNCTLSPQAASKFTYEATGFNSLPSIVTTGGLGAGLTGTLSSTLASGTRPYVWLVGQFTSLTSAYMLSVHSSGDTRWIALGEFSGDWESARNSTGSNQFTSFTSSVSDTSRHLFEGGFTFGGLESLVVSNVATSNPDTAAIDTALNTVRLNNLNGTITSVAIANFRVAEIIGSRSLPTGVQRAQVISLLQSRYGTL